MANEMDEYTYLNSLEKRLSESLRPVRPDPSFIHSLKERLSQNTNVMLEKPASNNGLIMLGIGLFAGALILLLLSRKKSG
jgi:LPXTG-motif cell wall-anchored protein